MKILFLERFSVDILHEIWFSLIQTSTIKMDCLYWKVRLSIFSLIDMIFIYAAKCMSPHGQYPLVIP